MNWNVCIRYSLMENAFSYLLLTLSHIVIFQPNDLTMKHFRQWQGSRIENRSLPSISRKYFEMHYSNIHDKYSPNFCSFWIILMRCFLLKTISILFFNLQKNTISLTQSTKINFSSICTADLSFNFILFFVIGWRKKNIHVNIKPPATF